MLSEGALSDLAGRFSRVPAFNLSSSWRQSSILSRSLQRIEPNNGVSFLEMAEHKTEGKSTNQEKLKLFSMCLDMVQPFLNSFGH